MTATAPTHRVRLAPRTSWDNPPRYADVIADSTGDAARAATAVHPGSVVTGVRRLPAPYVPRHRGDIPAGAGVSLHRPTHRAAAHR